MGWGGASRSDGWADKTLLSQLMSYLMIWQSEKYCDLKCNQKMTTNIGGKNYFSCPPAGWVGGEGRPAGGMRGGGTIINDVDGEISVTVTKAGWAGVTNNIIPTRPGGRVLGYPKLLLLLLF